MRDISIREVALAIPFELQIAAVLILGLMFILRVQMNKTKTFKEKLIQLKEVKGEVVGRVLKNLDSLHYLTKKLLQDKEVVGQYNTETIILALKTVNKLEKLENSFDSIDDSTSVSTVKEYTGEMKVTLSTIYHLENNLYDTKKKSEQLLLSYDRAFNRLNSDHDYDRTEEIRELKQNFKNEMAIYKSRLVDLENTYQQRRDELEEKLKTSNEVNQRIQNFLKMYKEKNIDSKKMYWKHFTYA